MADKKFDLDEVKKSVKNKQKKETNMKNSKVIETIKTVVIVLLLVAIAIVATYYIAYNQGTHDEKNRAEAVKAEVKSLTAIVSKQ